MLLIASVVVAAVLIGAGFVLLRGGGSETPTVLRGYIPLDSSPTHIGMDIPRIDSFYLTDGETLTGVGIQSQEIRLTPVDAPGAIQVEAMSGVGFGFRAKTANTGVLQLSSYSDEVDDVVALPSADCCADVLVGTDNGFIAFPEASGSSDSYLEYNGIEGPAWIETALPAPITVTSAALVEGFLFVGHTQGLLALSPWDGCSEPVTLWDQPTAALAVTHPDMTGPTVAALDTQNRAIAVVDPGMTRFTPLTECDSVVAPRLERVLSIGALAASGYQPSIALIDTTAYVVDTGGTVHIVDVGSGQADLVRDIALPNLPAEGVSLIAVPDWLEEEWNVFVADPAGSRLWWIGIGGRDAPDTVIAPVSES